jgi:DNA-binding IscR family transcriptional regulator
MRALCVLASAPEGCTVKADEIAEPHRLPRTFLNGIAPRRLVESRPCPDGGHRMPRPAHAICLADRSG